MDMANHTARFESVKTVAKPTTLKFKTKSGETVYIKALRTYAKKRAPARVRTAR